MAEFPQMTNTPDNEVNELVQIAQRNLLDLRLVAALAGERSMTAREEQAVEKLKQERGESLFSDMLYTLTRRTFPSRQAKTLWLEIGNHRLELKDQLGRDPGLPLAAHDYLTNVSGILRNVGLIEENKFNLLATVAVHDGLTGLYDKTTFTRILADEIARAQRYKRPLTVMLADIDNFKALNDTYGHADGDVVLQQVAEIIRHHCRSSDIPGRFGGEEFGVVLTEAGIDGALVFAERVRHAIESRFGTDAYHVTVSIGLAELRAEDTGPTVLKRTDQALYRAKAAGRNRVEG